MKIAYLVHFRGGGESGILPKVAGHLRAWSRSGAEVGLFAATSPGARSDWAAIPSAIAVRTPPTGPLALAREREALVGDLARWEPDVVYLRHGLVYPGLIRLARRTPCVVEINGDDLSELRLMSSRRYWFARVTRGWLLKRAAGLVYVTRELSETASFAKFGRPGIVIGNGIDLQTVDVASVPSNDRPHLVFVGHPGTPWHGLEHVREMATAFPSWQFDVVGPSPSELPDRPANLRCHGLLDADACRTVIGRADIGIGTLGLYRKNMQEASPLKVREYLAVGLPVIIGYSDTDFPTGAPFLLQVPNSDDGVRSSLGSIRTFVLDWFGRRVPRTAIEHLDVAAKEGARLRFIEAAPGA